MMFKIILWLEIIIFSFIAGIGIRYFKEKQQIIIFKKTTLEASINRSITSVTVINKNEIKETGKTNYCGGYLNLISSENKKYCFREPKLTETRGIEIDLTNQKALLYEKGQLIKILPLAYQAPEDRWFQSPTGYYRIGVKKEKHLSSLFPVSMPYSIQYYEDFFMHGIPTYENGNEVTSNFTGGCLRFINNIAKEIFDFTKTNDQIAVYKTFDDLRIKDDLAAPVDLANSWIRQRFGNPYRAFWENSGDRENLRKDYYNHTGLDFASNLNSSSTSVFSIYDGVVAKIQPNNGEDHGLGLTIILEHQIGKEKIYSLYAHLASINFSLKEGDLVTKGEILGKIGNSAYGCSNYWRIGKDGCNEKTASDKHLHFEIKTAPVLENPIGGEVCQRASGEKKLCYGYTPDYPQNFGYKNPLEFLFDKMNINESI